MIFTVLITLEQLNIAASVLNIAINILLASVGLAVAIAVGLGSKDIAGRLMEGLVNKLKGK
jgi:hypothetical protein